MAERYLDGMVGNGTFVALVLPDHLLISPQPNDLVDFSSTDIHKPWFSDHAASQLATAQMSEVAPSPAGISPRPLRFGVPALQVFPYKLWSRLVVRRARSMPVGSFTYQNLKAIFITIPKEICNQ
jgi:GntR family transcriptional regulator/MocR family aminotransferase